MKSIIVPVTVFPASADVLVIDSFHGLPPSYRWSLGTMTEGKDGENSYVELRAGNDQITERQWADWTTQSDDYLLYCAATNLGVTLVSSP